MKKYYALIILLFAAAASVACQSTVSPTPSPSPSTSPSPSPVSSAPELSYLLMDRYGDVFYCDPDYYPVGRPGQEEINAQEQFAAIRANETEFLAILNRLKLFNKADYTNEEKLQIYREHKKLQLGVQMTLSSTGIYQYSLRVGQGQGEHIQGTITQNGKITEQRREVSFNTCPICLTQGTIIDTPDGAVAVELLRIGMNIWTVNDRGERIPATIIDIGSTRVPSDFQVVRVNLDDGRSITASPGHRTADGRTFGNLLVGSMLDSGRIITVQYVNYSNSMTYDVLPSGATGLYWANGILLKSTLKQ